MSADGRTVLAAGDNVGGPWESRIGYVRVYSFNAQTQMWEQVGSDVESAVITGKFNQQFGETVAFSPDGTVFAAAAPYADKGDPDDHPNEGLVEVYEINRATNKWEQIGTTFWGGADDDLIGWGLTLSFNGNLLALTHQARKSGYPDLKLDGAGWVKVYERTSNGWSQVGGDFVGRADFDHLGYECLEFSNNGRLAMGHFKGGVTVWDACP